MSLNKFIIGTGLALFSNIVLAYNIGVYGQVGKGMAPVHNELTPGYHDTAYYTHYQLGVLFNSSMLVDEDRSHRFSFAYENKNRNFKGEERNRNGIGISYAYIFRIKKLSMGPLWLGPMFRLVKYDGDITDEKNLEDVTFTIPGLIVGMHHKYNNDLIFSYSLELANFEFLISDFSGDEGATTSVHANFAVYFK